MELIWRNDTTRLESSTKYQIEEMKMRSRCKLKSILSIVNVTEADEGNYSCNWDCNSRVAAVNLKVFSQSQTGKSLLKKKQTNKQNDATESKLYLSQTVIPKPKPEHYFV